MVDSSILRVLKCGMKFILKTNVGKKKSLKNATKLNLNSKCGEQISQKQNQNLVIFSKKTRIL
jgi:hypothetical protein